MDNLLFDLIRVAIDNQLCLSHTPTADEWGELYAMAKKQSLVGVCFAGVHKLCRLWSSVLFLPWCIFIGISSVRVSG